MTLPKVTSLRQPNTVRLIPSKYSEDSVLSRVADDAEHLDLIFQLDHATNDRLLAENDRLPEVTATELVFDRQHYRIINAAFCHASPTGARFNSPNRGAWYAGFSSDTSLAEVIFHKTLALQEIGTFEDSVTYDAYSADFDDDFHDIRDDDRFSHCLLPDDHGPAQTLAETLWDSGSNGVIYPSVRHSGGTCLACFHPKKVLNVLKQQTWRLTWSGAPTPSVSAEGG